MIEADVAGACDADPRLFLLVAALNEDLFRNVFMNMINATPVTVCPIVPWLPKPVPIAALAAIVV